MIINSGKIEDPLAYVAPTFKGQWVVVVTWHEPEDGICVEGPYRTYEDAHAACVDEAFLKWYANDGVVPEDVTFTILAMGEPTQSIL